MIDHIQGFLKGRKLILFGTGKLSEEVTSIIGIDNIGYYVDNNIEKQGKQFMGRTVHAPSVLLTEDKKNIMVLIASMYYAEIGYQLDAMGFEMNVNYILYNIIELVGDKFNCPCCKGSYNNFLTFGIVPRANAQCPVCNSLERHRLLWLFIENHTDILRSTVRVLHVAPEFILQQKLKVLENVEYVSIDINSSLADYKMDLTTLSFAENYFDVTICNHVLEHIIDDKKAMMEIYRTLKPGGFAYITVPIDKHRYNTYEDVSILSFEDRFKSFGQGDHVRIYGRDFIERLNDAGFEVSIYNVAEHYSDEQIKKYGLIKDDEIFLCRKENC